MIDDDKRGEFSVAGVDKAGSVSDELADPGLSDPLRMTGIIEAVEPIESDLVDLGAPGRISGNGMIGKCEGCSAMQVV